MLARDLGWASLRSGGDGNSERGEEDDGLGEHIGQKVGYEKAETTVSGSKEVGGAEVRLLRVSEESSED